MLEKGFKDDIEFILERANQSQNIKKIQHLFFSATMPKWVVALTDKFMNNKKNYLNLVSSTESQASTTVSHLVVVAEPEQKLEVLPHIIDKYS